MLTKNRISGLGPGITFELADPCGQGCTHPAFSEINTGLPNLQHGAFKEKRGRRASSKSFAYNASAREQCISCQANVSAV